ncbi:hyaluronidase-2 [Amia ocellicauda]|uniref:hyaluronidase-2 n=1 Tax=Amia ocellicauda TaxID=2972642 RepID=UPI0034638FF9
MAAALCRVNAKLWAEEEAEEEEEEEEERQVARSPISPLGCAVSRCAALLLAQVLQVVLCQGAKQAVPPVLPGEPFLVYWNAPTQQCHIRHGAPLPLRGYGIVANPDQAFSGNRLTIFYLDQLGLYPYYNRGGQPVNGGCPQNASLRAHSEKMIGDVQRALPWPSFSGLAVVDWEEWRPQWERNWASKDVYQRKSRELVHALHPHWPPGKVEKQAIWEFDSSAQQFLVETLRQGRRLRPAGLWGLYLFPDCYNHEYQRGLHNYTGHCPPLELRRNDALGWLFAESKALYPSVYLVEALRSSPQGRLFVRARVQEALRVADSTESPTALPVFVYSRPFYAYSLTPLTLMDLVSSIGESAALGASGVVLWGGMDYSSTRSACLELGRYLELTLGPYVANVTTAARLCSQQLCSSRGRCVRRDPEADAFLHLDSQSFSIAVQPGGGRVSVRGELSRAARATMRSAFQCQCYQGWAGDKCKSLAHRPKPGSTLLFLLLLLADLSTLWSLPI